MARLFSVDFNFQQETYTAIVSMYMKDDELLYDIKAYDMRLHSLLPDGKLSYKGKNGYETLNEYKFRFNRELILSIAGSIENYLSTSSPDYKF